MLSDLNPAERFAYEWQYGLLGGFSSALAEAIARADGLNRAKLAAVFPDEVLGIEFFQAKEGWWEDVEQKANS